MLPLTVRKIEGNLGVKAVTLGGAPARDLTLTDDAAIIENESNFLAAASQRCEARRFFRGVGIDHNVELFCHRCLLLNIANLRL